LTVLVAGLTFNHMVEYSPPFDLIFGSLADATRRDILRRVARAEHTVGELARPYAMSLAAIAKHVSKLERAGLVTKHRVGKEKVVRIAPAAIQAATQHLSGYEKLWAARYDALEELLDSEASKDRNENESNSQLKSESKQESRR
jgi:DNA-binding transcriptional ArsR family regulator